MKQMTGVGAERRKTALTRGLSVLSAGALLFTLIPWSATADTSTVGDGVTPTCDEAYYAMLDYYGNLTDGSVVKSYSMNGVSKITDYGTYDTVNNLTDGTAPSVSGGATTFDFGSDVPEHFYFEGKTSQPFEALPWKLTLSYDLNGVPTKAEDLAGQKGVVTIHLDMVPNASASEYAKDDYTLEAMSLFNQNDILSLKAEGAQVQLVGNLRMVLFLAMPGEEQHVTIEVGTNSFAFDGVTFLMVPATLSQLDQIADLKNRKDELEDDYNKLNGSVDTLLDSLDAMGGSLRETADGLDELNQARGTISGGKDEVYANADKVIGDLSALNGNLSDIPAHLDTASQAVTAVSGDLTTLTKTVTGLKKQLTSVQKDLAALQDDMDDVKDAMVNNSTNLKSDLTSLSSDVSTLKTDLATLQSSLSADNVTVGGQSLSSVHSQVSGMSSSYDATYHYVTDSTPMDAAEFAIAASIVNAAQKGSYLTPAQAAAQIQTVQTTISDNVTALITASVDPTTHTPTMDQATALQKVLAASPELAAAYQQSQLLSQVYSAVAGSSTMTKAQFYTAMLMLSAIQTSPSDAATILASKADYAETAQTISDLSANYGIVTASSNLLTDMGTLCDIMGSSGVTADLTKLTGLSADVLTDLDSLNSVAQDIVKQSETALDQAQALDDTLNQYVPDLQSLLTDTKSTVSGLSATMGDTVTFLTSFESLMKKSGKQLDSGTKKTLTGLSSTLRKAADSLDSTGSVRTAKDNISDVIEDTWNKYTGDVNNLLNMDSTADAESLTSSKNPSPQSVQVLIRSQEIKVSDEEESEKTQAAASTGTFWSRVAAMFKGIGSSIAGVFEH